VVPDPLHGGQPFPLTDLQQAYWVGRQDHLEMGNDGTHNYAEYDVVDLDVPRWEAAWRRLIARHDMLRCVVLPDGRQRILSDAGSDYRLNVTDLSHLAEATQMAELTTLRDRLSQQVLDLTCWPAFEVRLTRLDA